MTRLIALVAVASALAACAPRVPASNPGPGANDYRSYEIERARREAGVAAGLAPTTSFGAPPAVAAAAAPIGAAPPSGIGAADLAAAGIGQARPGGQPTALPPAARAPLNQTDYPAVLPSDRVFGVEATPANAAPVVVNNLGISDEQDFTAVSNRESIESDAQRRARQAAAYQVVQPTALPDPPADTGPNIVEYALNAPNRRGQAWYSRFTLFAQSRFERNCAEYRSPDEAQRDFLARGGPERDPRGLDPDGDGFACGWDPAPFRAAVGRN